MRRSNAALKRLLHRRTARTIAPYARQRTFADRAMALGPILCAPLWDATGSPQAQDISGNGFHGTPTDVVFGAAGIGDGRTAATFNGATSEIDFYSAGLAAAFNTSTGTVFFFVANTDWSVINKYILSIGVNVNNMVLFHQAGTPNTPRLVYTAGGTASARGWAEPDNNFWSATMTWDKPNDVVKYYSRGVSAAADRTGLGVWAGAIVEAKIGFGTMAGALGYYDGRGALFALWDRALSADEVASIGTL